MKKLLTLALAGAAILGTAACGSDSEKEYNYDDWALSTVRHGSVVEQASETQYYSLIRLESFNQQTQTALFNHVCYGIPSDFSTSTPVRVGQDVDITLRCGLDSDLPTLNLKLSQSYTGVLFIETRYTR